MTRTWMPPCPGGNSVGFEISTTKPAVLKQLSESTGAGVVFIRGEYAFTLVGM
ncbi:hypothetical protein L2K20_17770 [Mycobacterium sp. MBM]|jgi:hypothetical protein|uniref:hypothetical protein n=1 Tax=Mycolicibacterium sp. 018/SC-01/001 TaxID=2592069 RepID=UPI00163DDF49|nr:hypothetical protein [Mycolicibacterium sp. 018/SC-01/001]MCF6388830.1 hypothetical protein [Mycobacterium sp. MBM]